MKTHIWFRAKCYGWGWYPSTWQGWLVLLVWLILLFLWIGLFDFYFSIEKNVLGYLVGVFVLTGSLIYLCWIKGEKPRWRWGE